MQEKQNRRQEIEQNYSNVIWERHLLCMRRQKRRGYKEQRSIYCGIADVNVCNNRIETSKYNYFTFIPKNLLVQFSKLANLYFIIVGICQIIPQITTTDGKPLVYSPLTIVVLISMVKDFFEDRKRRKQDEFENQSITRVFNFQQNSFQNVTWESLRIGDIIQIQENEKFPADVLILSASGKQGSCYIETKNLDGETNMKFRQSCAPSIFLNDNVATDKNNEARFQFTYEDPNINIHNFQGVMKDQRNQDQNTSNHILNQVNICLRGCSLKRTASITALVIYTGHDCKSLKYSNAPRYKFGTLEKSMNKMVMFVFCILLSISIFCAAYYLIWYEIRKDEFSYLHITNDDFESKPAANFFLRIPMWILLLNTFVPISLLVTLEIVKYLQGQLLSKDKNFENKLSSELVEVNGSNLIDQLGSVKYLLTDKTGTLTGNVMKFKALSTNSVSYQHTQYDDNGILKDQQFIQQLSEPNKNILEFECMICMSICHQLIIIEENGKKKYIGQSADEECFMEFCIETGIYLESVDEHKVMTIVDSINKKKYKYKIIALHEYRSEIKKMSILVQDLDTLQFKLYQKGSMDVIFKLLRENQHEQRNIVEQHLDQFASNMLRTLCLSYRILTEQEVQEFLKLQRDEIENGVLNLEKMNDDTFKLIENEQILLGGTGVNDELGDQVVATLANLKKAGIRIWMITGDKKETALSIGLKSCVIDNDSELLVFKDSIYYTNNEAAQLLAELKQFSSSIINANINQDKKNTKNDLKKYSLGVSGQFYVNIHNLNDPEINMEFNNLMKYADSVIAFHFTPKQKAQLVSLVHSISPGQCVLAIGDGANDINMIQTANVGIGIRGKEGREASKASDFSIAEFKHLNRLILYVGQEAYRKNSYLILFNFYKNQAWNLPYFWFNFYCGQSGQYIYDQWMAQFFNLFYASIPIIIYALFDEIHPSSEFFQLTKKSKNLLELLPQDYKKFTDNLIFTQKTFWKWLFHGSIHSLIITFIAFESVGEFSDKNGRQVDIFFQGMHAYTSSVILGNLKVLQLHRTHYFFTLLVIYGSIAFYVSNLQIASHLVYLDSYGVMRSLFSEPNTYFGFILMILATYGIDSAYQIFSEYSSQVIYPQSIQQQQQQIQGQNVMLEFTQFNQQAQNNQNNSNQQYQQQLKQQQQNQQIQSMDQYNSSGGDSNNNTRQNDNEGMKDKKEIENSLGDIKQKLLIYSINQPSSNQTPSKFNQNIINNNNNNNNPYSSKMIRDLANEQQQGQTDEVEEPYYYDNEDVINSHQQNSQFKNSTIPINSQNILPNTLPSPPLLNQKQPQPF